MARRPPASTDQPRSAARVTRSSWAGRMPSTIAAATKKVTAGTANVTHGAARAIRTPPTAGPTSVPMPSIVPLAALLATSSSGARASEGISVM